jgi:hypothetical protein
MPTNWDAKRFPEEGLALPNVTRHQSLWRTFHRIENGSPQPRMLSANLLVCHRTGPSFQVRTVQWIAARSRLWPISRPDSGSATRAQRGLLLKRSAENAKRDREQRYSLLRVSAPALVIARGLDIWEIIRASVPEWWPAEKREETISRLGLAVSEGRVSATPQAIEAAVQKAASAHNKMFSEWAVGGGAGKWVSLEAPKYEDGATTVGDTVSQGLWE